MRGEIERSVHARCHWRALRTLLPSTLHARCGRTRLGPPRGWLVLMGGVMLEQYPMTIPDCVFAWRCVAIVDPYTPGSVAGSDVDVDPGSGGRAEGP